MEFQKPTNALPKRDKEPGIWSKLLALTASDTDYEVPIRIAKAPTKPRKPMDIKRSLLSALTILVAGYLLLIGYLLVNIGDQAVVSFYQNFFHIEFLVLRRIIEYTIYIFYAIIGLIVGLGFLFFGFRALAVRTKKIEKRIFLWVSTVIFMSLFFTNILLFARTQAWFMTMALSDQIFVYDNTILNLLPKGLNNKSVALVSPSTTLSGDYIGPFAPLYDISGYFRKTALLNSLSTSKDYPYEFWIDYNNDKAPDSGSQPKRSDLDINLYSVDPLPAQIAPDGWQYTQGSYTPTAWVKGTNYAGQPTPQIDLKFPTITIREQISTSPRKIEGTDIEYTVFDASSLKKYWRVRWVVLDTWFESGLISTNMVSSDGSTFNASYIRGIVNDYIYDPKTIFEEPVLLCLQFVKGDESETIIPNICDWKHLIELANTNISIDAIHAAVDPLNPLKYRFTIDPVLKKWVVRSILWTVESYEDNQPRTIKEFKEAKNAIEYTFPQNGHEYRIKVAVQDSESGSAFSRKELQVFTAKTTDLKRWYTLQITDESGIDVAKNALDSETKSYLLSDIGVPGTLEFNSTKVLSTNPRLTLVNTEWDGDGDAEHIFEKSGPVYAKEFALPGRYVVNVRYTFEDVTIEWAKEKIYYYDRVIVVGVKKPINVVIKPTLSSTYAPATVRFDLSGTTSTIGNIAKYTINFGDGKTSAEQEGVIPNHYYPEPGEYRVTIEAVTVKGDKASKTIPLVLKKKQEVLQIGASIASWLARVGDAITFDSSVEGEYISITWNMGDGKPEFESIAPVIYSYEKPGKYTITTRVLYKSGNVVTKTIKDYEIKGEEAN